jgi:DNA-directed RNA polymerase specialized sigma24 family protein
MELPPSWVEYARLQAISAHTFTIDSSSWGLEEEMTSFLDDPSTYTPAKEKRLKRLAKTVARRERFRSNLRKVHHADLAPEPVNTVSQLEARDILQQIGKKVSATQWAVMSAFGQGYSHDDIAPDLGISAGAIRLQLFRLRQRLSEFRPAA